MPKKSRLKPLTARQIRALPAVVGLETAAAAFGIGRSQAYGLAKIDEFPCAVLRVGHSYRVRRADIMKATGVTETPERPADEAATDDAA